jgi:hypothetical protein
MDYRTAKVKRELQALVDYSVLIQEKCLSEENLENHALKAVHTNSSMPI